MFALNSSLFFPACSSNLPDVACIDGQVRYENGTCFENGTFVGLWDYNTFHNATGIKRQMASEEYF